MKKKNIVIAMMLAAAMLATACGAKTEAPAAAPAPAAEEKKEDASQEEAPAEEAKEEETAEAETAEGTYDVYNVTGEKLTDLYLYEVGADKGENLVPDGLRNNKKIVLTYEAKPDAVLVLEFTTEGGTTNKFETLHIEEAPIALLSVDAMTGATPISFEIPEDTGNYKLINKTGEDVTELYVYPVGGDKGENLAGDGMANDAETEFSFTGPVDTELVVEFTTETDGTKTFDTLHIEEAAINLLAADAMTGATPIEFGF